jgi:hypothetical protein
MSIINDALKKLQSERQGPAPVATPNMAPSVRNDIAPPAPELTARPESSSRKTTSAPRRIVERAFSRSLFMYVLIIVCGLVAFSLLKAPVSYIPQTVQPAVAPTTPSARQTSAVQQTTGTALPVGVLPMSVQGIVQTGDERTALINEDVYQVGDTIQGLAITAILDDRVILSQGSSEIVLKVNGKR